MKNAKTIIFEIYESMGWGGEKYRRFFFLSWEKSS
jgi:hypothetical protein